MVTSRTLPFCSCWDLGKLINFPVPLLRHQNIESDNSIDHLCTIIHVKQLKQKKNHKRSINGYYYYCSCGRDELYLHFGEYASINEFHFFSGSPIVLFDGIKPKVTQDLCSFYTFSAMYILYLLNCVLIFLIQKEYWGFDAPWECFYNSQSVLVFRFSVVILSNTFRFLKP